MVLFLESCGENSSTNEPLLPPQPPPLPPNSQRINEIDNQITINNYKINSLNNSLNFQRKNCEDANVRANDGVMDMSDGSVAQATCAVASKTAIDINNLSLENAKLQSEKSNLTTGN